MVHGFSATEHRFGPASETWASLHSVVLVASRPANLLAVLVVLLGWAALISWTGNGTGGWQARTCTGLELASRSCAEVRLTKDASRIVPHTAEFASWAR